MLKTCMQYSDTDITFLQAVVKEYLQHMTGYTAHTNIGAEERGTAILTRETVELTAIENLPNGRRTAAR
jgi:hypothetical protein